MAYRTSKYTKGLYFTGFSEEDGNPDVGDSAITETVGVGAMAEGSCTWRNTVCWCRWL